MKLCCGRAKCAEITLIGTEPDQYEIKDDYGGSVVLNKDELKMLKEYEE